MATGKNSLTKEYLKDVSLDQQYFKQQKPLPDIPTTKFTGWHRVDWNDRRTVIKIVGAIVLLGILVATIACIAVYYSTKGERVSPHPTDAPHAEKLQQNVTELGSEQMSHTPVTMGVAISAASSNASTTTGPTTNASTTTPTKLPLRNGSTTASPEVPDLRDGHWMVEKLGWGGRPPKYAQLQFHPTPYVVISETGGLPCISPLECIQKVQVIQEMHMDKFPDIGFNFLIGGDGNVYVGRGWDVTNFHVGFARHRNIGICFIGDYFFDEPTTEQLEVVQDLIAMGVEMNKLSPNYTLVANNQLLPFTGPGMNLMRIINTWPNRCLVDCDLPGTEDVIIVLDYADDDTIPEI